MDTSNIGCTCFQCGRKTKRDNTHYPLCSRCWERTTDEGKEYMRIKKQESRLRKGETLKKSSKCISCGATIYLNNKHFPLCRKCWDKTDEGREHMRIKNKKAFIRRNAELNDLSSALGDDIPKYHIKQRLESII